MILTTQQAAAVLATLRLSTDRTTVSFFFPEGRSIHCDSSLSVREYDDAGRMRCEAYESLEDMAEAYGLGQDRPDWTGEYFRTVDRFLGTNHAEEHARRLAASKATGSTS